MIRKILTFDTLDRKQSLPAKLTSAQTHHTNFTRFFLLILAIIIFSFNAIVSTTVGAQDSSSSITINNVFTKQNQVRVSNNLKPFTLNSALSQSAQSKGDAMIKSDCWSHYCPNGKSPWNFFESAGYKFAYAGENLAEGFYNVNELMNAWINSPTHKANILSKNFKEVGLGISYGKFQGNSNNILIVVHFGSPIENVPVSNSNTPVLPDKINTNTNSLIPNTPAQLPSSTINNTNHIDNSNNILGTNKSNTISLNLNLSESDKNLLNLVFVTIISLFFLADIILTRRTHAVISPKSLSHYHLALMLVVSLVIITGGFGGGIL